MRSGVSALTGVALLLAARLVSGATAGSPSWVASWVDGAKVGRRVIDLSLAKNPAIVLQPGEVRSVPLPFPVQFRGALYDHLIVGPDVGRAMLTYGDMDPFDPDVHALLMLPMQDELSPGPRATIQVRLEDQGFAVRWAGFRDPKGDPATFDAVVLAPTADEAGANDSGQATIQYQYLQVPQWLKDTKRDAVRLEDRARPDALAAPTKEGFGLMGGKVIVFPGDTPWNPPADPLTGCGIAQSWCTVVQSQDPGCITPANYTDMAVCTDTVRKRWQFNEGAFCRSCPYQFYVTVECGTEMHLPFRDMEGNQVRITDVFTGTQLELVATNDCAKQSFLYCNNCEVNGTPLPLAPGVMTCPTVGGRVPTTSPCIPYFQRSNLIQWGWPFQDLDGDTVLDDLPCGPPNTDTCNGYMSGGYYGTQEQNTDVILNGSPALCGVFRLDILSGGFHWFLSANCTGIVPDDPATIAQNFNVYQNCSDAIAAFDPLPELAITRLSFTGICPNIQLVVEITNLGCSDALTSPVDITFSDRRQATISTNLGAVPAGTAVTTTIPVTLRSTPMTATASVDPANIIAECTEQAAGSFSGCSPTTGADSLDVQLCLCANTVQALVVNDRLSSCNSSPVVLDATPSSAVPCAGGQVEFKFTDSTGGILQDWSTTPTLTVTPVVCPSLRSYAVQARCSLETAADCLQTAGFTVECATAQNLSAAVSASPICRGASTTLTASAGFATYLWDDGETTRSITVRPAVDTVYHVTAVDGGGCILTAAVTVQVIPDPIPGPLGNYLRVKKSGGDVAFKYRELPGSVGEYVVVCHAPAGSDPCPIAAPAVKPTPIVMQAASAIGMAAPGAAPWSLHHVGGLTTCPRLLFYKVLATSPCTHTWGPACEPWPHQGLPCP